MNQKDFPLRFKIAKDLPQLPSYILYQYVILVKDKPLSFKIFLNSKQQNLLETI